MNEHWFFYIWTVLAIAVFVSIHFYHTNKRFNKLEKLIKGE